METIFITGGTGYIGQSVVKSALLRRLSVKVLTRSEKKAKLLKKKGVIPIIGDMLQDGLWLEELKKAEYVMHLASPQKQDMKVTKKAADLFKSDNLEMTKRLFNNINAEVLRKLVYNADASYLGDAGEGHRANENYKSEPTGWGRYMTPAVELANTYAGEGLPVVTAFPGQVYGADSWLLKHYLESLYAKRSVTAVKGYNPLLSPIHIDDCGKALLFLLEKGEVGEPYILVDDRTLPRQDFLDLAADKMGASVKTYRISRWIYQFLSGPILTEYATRHTNFSNKKLKKLGFTYRYPTSDEGMEQVVQEWCERKKHEMGARPLGV